MTGYKAARRFEDDAVHIAKTVADNYDDEEVREQFLEVLVKLVVEQPFKIQFVAVVILAVNTIKSDVTADVLKKTVEALHGALDIGAWRDVKLLLRFLGSLQGILEGDGVFSILEELFSRAVDLQTSSSEDVSYGIACSRHIIPLRY